jgi:gliding motility-associated-like protein
MKQINYFKIFNRWGQLIFSTTKLHAGWDGTFKGRPQDAAVFVWIIEGVDYLDKKVTQKGTVTLIR